MRRGDVVTVVSPGSYGKPRPAVVVQSDWLGVTDSVIVCLLTSTVSDAPLYRLTVEPTPGNGLRITSQVMVEKLTALPRVKWGGLIGRLDPDAITALDRMLSLMLGLAD